MRTLPVCLALGLLSGAQAQVNNWINPGSARWDSSTNWSLGTLPASSQSVNILNSGYKAVNIDGATVSSSLTVSSLTVGAPNNALSTLLLNYFGLNATLKVLTSCRIQTNGTIQNLSSSFEVDGGASDRWTIDGGTFIQDGGLTVIKPTVELENGTINATNATMNLGTLNMGRSPTSGNFSQSGGTVLTAGLRIDIGSYTLLDHGTLYAIDKTILAGSAHFDQISGTNYGDVILRPGTYNLYDGLLRGNDLNFTGNGNFFQHGGAAGFATMEIYGTQGGPNYQLESGTLHCGNLDITGLFRQYGGTLTLTNGLYMPSGIYDLVGGTVFMPSMVISNSGLFNHFGGTNVVAGDANLYNTGMVLKNGRFSSANLGIGVGAAINQSAGSNQVSGVLSITGNYFMSSGVLSVGGMYLRGAIFISFSPGLTPPLFINTGLINFGGALNISASQNSMGQLGLSANGTINLGAASLVVRFADSSALNWDANSRLVIAGWNGSYSGNGSNQIYFGTTSGGLTPSKLSQVSFLNPAGIPPGTYNARILSNGEVVPIAPPTLQAVRNGSALVLTWPSGFQLLSATNITGPYTPVSGATSPRTNSFSKPREFFKLQGL